MFAPFPSGSFLCNRHMTTSNRLEIGTIYQQLSNWAVHCPCTATTVGDL